MQQKAAALSAPRLCKQETQKGWPIGQQAHFDKVQRERWKDEG